MNLPTLSFEFFPPKTAAGHVKLIDTIKRLNHYAPELVTLTCAAANDQDCHSLETFQSIHAAFPALNRAAHLTFLSATKAEISAQADHLWAKNIRSIVALRGDIPEGKALEDFASDAYYRYTNEFIAGLKAQHDFTIYVGTYPEKHPESVDQSQDLMALKYKAQAGADKALTQFFFDNEVFYDFCAQAQDYGIDIPICPGILPIQNYSKLVSFAKTCQATIPRWIIDGFERHKDCADSQQHFAQDILNKQVADLAKNNIAHIHFYTLNNAKMIENCLNTL